MPTHALAADVHAKLRAFPDFPTPGIRFQDIAPVLADPALRPRVIDALAAPSAGRVDKVAGIESRGFTLGAPVALRLGVGFVPLRKRGKLPGPTLVEPYALEYGEAALEAQADAFAPGDRVLIVDDVLATGGTAGAAARIVARAGGRVDAFAFLLEIAALGGRAKLAAPATILASM